MGYAIRQYSRIYGRCTGRPIGPLTQTMIDDIFRDLIAKGVVCVYLDDILIYIRKLEEHRRVVREVLNRLREYKLFLKHEKCEFECAQIKYLRLIVGQGRAEMNPVKVVGVRDWSTKV
jgi:hypothetical protein